MFATRRRLNDLTRELQQTRLIVNRLRRDLNAAQRQLSELDGWGDEFIKTREISGKDTRFFDRQLDRAELQSGCPAFPDGGLDAALHTGASEADEGVDSAVRRRFG